jgi:hypothetical protein
MRGLLAFTTQISRELEGDLKQFDEKIPGAHKAYMRVSDEETSPFYFYSRKEVDDALALVQ